jgi:hypothetical protein
MQGLNPTWNIMSGMGNFLDLLKQSYGDLNEVRTAELQLQELTQAGTVPEYLTRFTQYSSRVTWDTRAKMAQFYKGLSPKIKDAMALLPFPGDWAGLIGVASQLDDNFRRRSQEEKGKGTHNRFGQTQKKQRHPDEMDWTASAAVKRNPNGKFRKQGQKKKGKCYNCGKEGHFAAECRSAHKASSSDEPRKSPRKNKGKRGNQRKEKVHELRGEERERDESSGEAPIYFHLLRGGAPRRGSGQRTPSTSTLSDPPPPFRTTEDLPATAQAAGSHCTNPEHKAWEQVQTKLRADLREYQQMNTNLVTALTKTAQETQAEMMERVTRLMKNFDEVSTMLTRIITAEGLCVYCQARRPGTENATTQTETSEQHKMMTWTACYDDLCPDHYSDKAGAGWFPQEKTPPERSISWTIRDRVQEMPTEETKGKNIDWTRKPFPSRGEGRSTSPENDHHYFMGNQSGGPHKLMTLNVNVQGHKAKAVIDSGCTGNMISPKFANKVGIQRFKRAQKVYLYTFDGSPVKENNGMIEEETGEVSLKIGRHEERTKFDIITTQGYDITLGLPWLTEHNPTIDYTNRAMQFDNCMHDGRRNPKIELEEISLKAMSMHYHKDPDSVVLAMVSLENTK